MQRGGAIGFVGNGHVVEPFFPFCIQVPLKLDLVYYGCGFYLFFCLVVSPLGR